MRLQDALAWLGDTFTPNLVNAGKMVNDLGNKFGYLNYRLQRPIAQKMGLLNDPERLRQYDQAGQDMLDTSQAMTNQLNESMGGDYSKIQGGDMGAFLKQLAFTGGGAGLEVAPFVTGAGLAQQPIKQALPTLAKEGGMYGVGYGGLNAGQAYNQGERNPAELAKQGAIGFGLGMGGEFLGYGAMRGASKAIPAIKQVMQTNQPGFARLPDMPQSKLPNPDSLDAIKANIRNLSREQLAEIAGNTKNIKVANYISSHFRAGDNIAKQPEIEKLVNNKQFDDAYMLVRQMPENPYKRSMMKFIKEEKAIHLNPNAYTKNTIAYHGISNGTQYADDGSALGLGKPYLTTDPKVAERYADNGAVADYLFRKDVPLSKQYTIGSMGDDNTFKEVGEYMKAKGVKDLTPENIYKHYSEYTKQKGYDMITGEAYEPNAGFTMNDSSYLGLPNSKTMYHNSDSKLYKFDPTHTKQGVFGKGLYLSDAPETYYGKYQTEFALPTEAKLYPTDGSHRAMFDQANALLKEKTGFGITKKHIQEVSKKIGYSKDVTPEEVFLHTKNDPLFNKAKELLQQDLEAQGYVGMREMPNNLTAGMDIIFPNYAKQLQAPKSYAKAGQPRYIYDTAPKPDDPMEALKAEARKYKSAEEFVKAQGDSLYHGGGKLDKIKNMQGKWGAIYATENPTYAKSFGGKNSVLNEVVVSKDAKLADLRKPSKELIDQITSKIDEKLAKAKPYDDKAFSLYPYSRASVIDGIKKGKGHIAELPEVKQVLKELGYDGQLTKEVPFASNYGVWNKSKIQTKQQLTDLYNQAHKGKPTGTGYGALPLALASLGLGYNQYK